MTKQEMINDISKSTEIEKFRAGTTIESLMEVIRVSLTKKQTIYLLGLNTFR